VVADAMHEIFSSQWGGWILLSEIRPGYYLESEE